MREEPDEPAPVDAEAIEEVLEALVEQLIEARGDDDPLGRLADDMRIGRVATFGAAGLLARGRGVVIACDGGTEFQVTVVRSR